MIVVPPHAFLFARFAPRASCSKKQLAPSEGQLPAEWQ